MSPVTFSKARGGLALLMKKVAGSSRVYKISNSRHGSEAALLDWDYLVALRKEAEILSDTDRLVSILKSREAYRRGGLKEYTFADRTDEASLASKLPVAPSRRTAKSSRTKRKRAAVGAR